MRLSRLWAAGIGLCAILVPRYLLALHRRISLIGYRNRDTVEPSRLLVLVTRLAGLVVIIATIRQSETDANTEDSPAFV